MPTNPHRASARPGASVPVMRPSSTPFAVLIDGSALFLTVRSIHEGRQLDYRQLVNVLCNSVEGLPPSWQPISNLWVMWTSVSPQNQGQARFLDFAENELGWETRRFSPADSYMVDPSGVLGLGAEGRSSTRLLRFDAPIAFAMGRLAESHSLVIVSDSYTLSDAFLRSARVPTASARSRTLAFFGRSLDARWQRTLRTDPASPTFIDLDEHESELFGDTQPSGHKATEKSHIVF
jgi:hypothetical protein